MLSLSVIIRTAKSRTAIKPVSQIFEDSKSAYAAVFFIQLYSLIQGNLIFFCHSKKR